MSVDCRITVKRKEDDKVLGSFWANSIKNLIDSQYSDKIHCSGRCDSCVEFTPDELDCARVLVQKDIDSHYNCIFEKKMMIPMCANSEIKAEIEDEIRALKEEIDDLFWVHWSCCHVSGMISALVEDNIRECDSKDAEGENETLSAYEYNGSDLPLVKSEYSELPQRQYVWNRDVYCVLELL